MLAALIVSSASCDSIKAACEPHCNLSELVGWLRSPTELSYGGQGDDRLKGLTADLETAGWIFKRAQCQTRRPSAGPRPVSESKQDEPDSQVNLRDYTFHKLFSLCTPGKKRPDTNTESYHLCHSGV